MYIKNTGLPGQPPQTEVERYEWIIPVGWRITGTHETGSYLTPLNTIQIEPSNPGNICSAGGGVKVRGIASGQIRCIGISPSISNQSTITLTRTPAISLLPPTGYVGPTCNLVTPVTFAVTPLSCASSYSWSHPSGWSRQTSTSTNYVTLTPGGTPDDGTDGGNEEKIKVTADIGGCSVNTSYQLTYQNPTILISGTGPVCTSGKTFSVNAPSGSTTQWEASPGDLLLVSSGSGNSAFLEAAIQVPEAIPQFLFQLRIPHVI